MTPQIRETEQTPIAVPFAPSTAAPVNVTKIAKPAVEIKAPAPHEEAETGKKSMLDKRRRRRARLSGRH